MVSGVGQRRLVNGFKVRLIDQMAGAVKKIPFSEYKSNLAAFLLAVCAYTFLCFSIFSITNYAEYKLIYIKEYSIHREAFEILNKQIEDVNEAAIENEAREEELIPKFKFPSFLSHISVIADNGGLFWFIVQFMLLSLGINVLRWSLKNHKKHLVDEDYKLPAENR